STVSWRSTPPAPVTAVSSSFRFLTAFLFRHRRLLPLQYLLGFGLMNRTPTVSQLARRTSMKHVALISSVNGMVARWKSIAGAVLTAALLLPVPAFATIANFIWDASPTVSGQNPFASFDTSQTTSSQGILLLTLANPAPTFTQGTSTWSIVGHF